MATSGTISQPIMVDEMIRLAFRPLGVVAPTGDEARVAYGQLNNILRDWVSMGIEFFGVGEYSIPLIVAPTPLATYTMPPDFKEIIDPIILRDANGIDQTVWRRSQEEFWSYSQKAAQAPLPSAYKIDRTRSAFTMTFWPVPTEARTLKVRYKRSLQLVSGLDQEIDIGADYQSALELALTDRLGIYFPGRMAPEIATRIEALARKAFDIAYAGDSDFEVITIMPVRPIG